MNDKTFEREALKRALTQIVKTFQESQDAELEGRFAEAGDKDEQACGALMLVLQPAMADLMDHADDHEYTTFYWEDPQATLGRATFVNNDPLKERHGLTHSVSIGGQRGYFTANYSEEWELFELFVVGFGKYGSTNQGWTDAFSIVLSLALQGGVQLAPLAKRFALMKFEPNGETDNPDIPFCYSIPDYIFRWLTHHFGTNKLKEELQQIHAEMERV